MTRNLRPDSFVWRGRLRDSRPGDGVELDDRMADFLPEVALIEEPRTSGPVHGCGSCVPCVTRSGQPCRLGTRPPQAVLPRKGPVAAKVYGGKSLPSVAAPSDITARILDQWIRPVGERKAEVDKEEGFRVCRRQGCTRLEVHAHHDGPLPRARRDG